MTKVPLLKDIQSLEEALYRPEIRRSREAVGSLLADGFFEFGSSGRVYDRARTIELLASESGAVESGLKTQDHALTLLAEGVVLLTYQSESTSENGLPRRVLRSSIWKQDGARWRMVFHQGTVRE